MTTPKLLSVRTLYEGWGRYLELKVRLEDGEEVEREMEDHGGAVAVLPYDPERRTALLVRQMRMAPLFEGTETPYLLEALAGVIEEGESAETSARREALEEVGVELTELQPVGRPYSTPGCSSERIDMYLAPYSRADRVEEGGGAEGEHENIRVIEKPLAELLEMVRANAVRDLKTVALILLLLAHHPELFAG